MFCKTFSLRKKIERLEWFLIIRKRNSSRWNGNFESKYEGSESGRKQMSSWGLQKSQLFYEALKQLRLSQRPPWSCKSPESNPFKLLSDSRRKLKFTFAFSRITFWFNVAALHNFFFSLIKKHRFVPFIFIEEKTRRRRDRRRVYHVHKLSQDFFKCKRVEFFLVTTQRSPTMINHKLIYVNENTN